MIPVLVLVVFSFAEANVNNISSIARIADMVHQLCPGANVCPEKRNSTEASDVTFFPGFGSCCTDCSCGQFCEDHGSCCFPKHSNQQSDDLNLKEEVSCLYPTTASPGFRRKYLLRAYNMVSSVLKLAGNEKKSATNISCGEEKVAPWGRLYPVYSTKQKRIYKNSVCAEAANVDDGELWDAKIYCIKTVNSAGIATNIDSILLGLESNFAPPNCRVDFIFPGDVEAARPLSCYLDLIDSCNRSDFQLPVWMHASTDEIIQACTSGLLSPYRHIALYKNVFCQICNTDNSFSRDAVCLVPNEVESRSEDNAFIGLLDGRVLDEVLKKQHVGVTQKKPKACPHRDWKGQKEDLCRTVFCPSGQLRDGRGKCTYIEKFWFNQEFTVDLLLTSDGNINMSEVFQVKHGQVSLTAPNFISPWHNGWNIESIYSDNFYGTKDETNIAVILNSKIKEVRPGQLVKYIEQKVNQKWYLIHNNVTHVLTSRMMKYNIDHKRDNESSITDFVIGNYPPPLFFWKQEYYHLYDTFKVEGYWHKIKTLYLCDQVELAQADFNLSLQNKILFNTLTGRYLLDNEFSLILSNTFEGYHARICVDDSGLYISDHSYASYGSIPFKIYDFWLFALVLLKAYVF